MDILTRQEKISERIRASHCIFKRNPDRWYLRGFHLLHGSPLIAKTGLVVATISFTSSMFYKVEPHVLQTTIFFCAVYVGASCTMTFWTKERRTLENLSNVLIVTAEAIEARSDPNQLAKMARIAKITRLLAAVYYSDIIVIGFMYEIIPLLQGRLAAGMPLLPETEFIFWTMYLVEATVQLCGLVSAVTILVYHLEVCLCLASLLSVLSDQFNKFAPSKNTSYLLVEIHQKLLESAKDLRNAFSFAWFVLLMLMIFMLVTSTYYLVINKADNVMFLVILVTCLGFSFTPCILGDLVSSSSENIAWGVYFSRWIDCEDDVRKTLLVTVHRSQRPAYLVGGLLGELVLTKYLDILKHWYRLVQFLLKLK